MPIIAIDDPADPRVADYLDIRERDLVGRQGRLIAEGRVVLETLLSPASRAQPLSALIAAHRIETLRPLLDRMPADAPVFAAGQVLMDAVVGFPIHRGILALAETPPPLSTAGMLAAAGPEAVVLAAFGVSNHDNLGGLIRNAAALGACGLILDDESSDPFYRKAIRVSAGAALRLPIARREKATLVLDALERAGFEPLALTPGGTSDLRDITPGERRALIVGAEGPGLPPDVLARCRPVAIPMHDGVDSLNVAAASAVALHHLIRL